jgi:hypothetical protein
MIDRFVSTLCSEEAKFDKRGSVSLPITINNPCLSLQLFINTERNYTALIGSSRDVKGKVFLETIFSVDYCEKCRLFCAVWQLNNLWGIETEEE